MNNEIISKLNELFQDIGNRILVFWYDEDKEFEEDLSDLKLDNAEIYVLNENSPIKDKYFLEFEKPESNFLIYAPFKQPKDSVNFFADMIHYGELFNADHNEILAKELGINSDMKDLIGKYSKFFRVKNNREKFKSLNSKLENENEISLGILAVLTNNTFDPRFINILRTVIIENLKEENKYLIEFKKRDVLEDFWFFCKKLYGYENKKDINILITSFLLTYTSNLFESEVPKPWEKFIIDNPDVYIFVGNFMKNIDFIEDYDELSSSVENSLNLENNLRKVPIESYFKCDTFTIFDELIINHSVDLLYSNRESLPFMDKLNARKTTHFYNKFENTYQMIFWANKIISKIHYLEKLEEPETVEDMLNEYINHWSLFDKYYRKFLYNYDKIFDKTKAIEDLGELINNIYANSFLQKINPWWTKALNKLESLNEVKINKQIDFYKQNIENSNHRKVVIISDAMRYNIAQELKERLDKNPKREAVVEPMLGVLPSYTKLGMAALLPHKKLDYDGDYEVLVDGLKCGDTKKRQKILQNYDEESIAISFNDLINKKRDEMNELFKGKNVIYIYHNHIDAIGDEKATEDKVFEAAEQTINEIEELIKKLTNNVSLSNFLVTADHGFIYKRGKQKESDKIDIEDKTIPVRGKRYILAKEKYNTLSTCSFNLDYIGLDDYYVTVPVGIDIFKAPGNGINYFHGGSSLQELIVPIVTVKSRKGKKDQNKVEIELMEGNNRITNHTSNLKFIQKENISNKVLPLEAKAYFADSTNKHISNEVLIYADKNSEIASDREFRKEFTLMSSINYDRTEDYYLIIEDAETLEELKRYTFTIDLAFDDGFTF